MQNKLSIILPVFNEKESLAIMVRLIKSTLKFENEILIVYDNINDNCVEEAKKLEKEILNVKAIHNDIEPTKSIHNLILFTILLNKLQLN